MNLDISQNRFTDSSVSKHQIKSLNKVSHSLKYSENLDPLMERIGDARIVMLGESSHGTHEFYTWRAKISKRLIEEKGFNFIAVEGDWPDCYRLNRYVKNYLPNTSAEEVLKNFNRWPTWMWANWEISAFAEWLKKHNQSLSRESKTGFYGLDVYSLWESMQAIMQYLEKTDPNSLQTAREAFQCFEPFNNDEQKYASFVSFVSETCEPEVLDLLATIRTRMIQYDGDYEQVFNTEQNALITVNAEKYYRSMVQGGPHSWNVRDGHMQETLERLLKFHGPQSKAIIWAHNTHIGDARATDMARHGMYNIGELTRKKFPDTVLVGFGTYKGSVIAGRYWGDEMRKMSVPEGIPNSWEHLLHHSNAGDCLLIMNQLEKEDFMKKSIGHRAIGVVYNPNQEHLNNYVPSILPLRYDAFLFIDESTALHPLHIKPDGHQMPETYPFGM